MKKKILIALLAIIIIGLGTAVYMWNKPHSRIEDTAGIAIDAGALAKEFSANEATANSKYLNKAIEVSGTVSDVEYNQEGGAMVILATDDPDAGVQCSMRDKGQTAEKGQKITVKGFCSGSGITGISLTACVIKK